MTLFENHQGDPDEGERPFSFGLLNFSKNSHKPICLEFAFLHLTSLR